MFWHSRPSSANKIGSRIPVVKRGGAIFNADMKKAPKTGLFEKVEPDQRPYIPRPGKYAPLMIACCTIF